MEQEARFSPYILEKRIWTDADYQQMGWHDNPVYKMHLATDLSLDIDCILQWNKPPVQGLGFTFWIAPATLVFESVTNISFDFDTAFQSGIEIDGIKREYDGDTTTWTIITQQGDMSFQSPGYTQFIRQDPFLKFGQELAYDERLGYSIEQTTNQENPNRYREDIVARRKKELEDYELVIKRQHKRIEKDSLELQREVGAIDLKAYLQKKREIKELIEYYDYRLSDTIFAAY
jgi:hypothetical protein